MKGRSCAGGGASAFGEDDDGVSVMEGVDGGVEGAEGGADVGGIDGDLSGAAEVPAEDGEGEEFFFGEDAELGGEVRVEQGDVHGGQVVGGVDLGLWSQSMCSAPRTVTRRAVVLRMRRAQVRAMRCCRRPSRSKSEAVREAMPRAPV